VLAGFEALINEGHATIGGGVQAVMLTSAGVEVLGLKKWSKHDNSLRDVDIPPDRVHSLTRQHERLRPLVHQIEANE
jgi:hypothetical protein